MSIKWKVWKFTIIHIWSSKNIQLYCHSGVHFNDFALKIMHENIWRFVFSFFKTFIFPLHNVLHINIGDVLVALVIKRPILAKNCTQWKTTCYKDWFWFFVFNAIFSNISAISWRPVLVVEEARVPGENHRSWASNW